MQASSTAHRLRDTRSDKTIPFIMVLSWLGVQPDPRACQQLQVSLPPIQTSLTYQVLRLIEASLAVITLPLNLLNDL
jgi:hypothetical protein